jgi:hypothetical protein
MLQNRNGLGMTQRVHFHHPELETYLIHLDMDDIEKNFVPGLSKLNLAPSINRFNDGTGTQMFGPGPVAANTSNQKAIRQPMSSAAPTYPAPLAANKRIQLRRTSASSTVQVTSDTALWLQKNRPDILAQMADQGGISTTNVALPIPGVSTKPVAPALPM